jgi:GNAT superfamily N-acetyltransferase
VKVKNLQRYGLLEFTDARLLPFYARHRDRFAGGDGPPAAVFGALHDPELEAVLCLYTQPATIVSLVVKEPASRPFMRIAKLVSAYEHFLKGTGATRYFYSVARDDVYYRHLVERWGGEKIGETATEIAYERVLGATPKAPSYQGDGIRPWLIGDWITLEPTVLKYLEEQARAGGPILPNYRSANTFIEDAMRGAQRGDPVLLATRDNKVAGFVVWIAPPTNYAMVSKRLTGMGTYVVPRFRRDGLATELRQAAEALARAQRFTGVDGIAYDTAGIQTVKSLGFVPAGILTRKEF